MLIEVIADERVDGAPPQQVYGGPNGPPMGHPAHPGGFPPGPPQGFGPNGYPPRPPMGMNPERA